jgi:hypothetical protein
MKHYRVHLDNGEYVALFEDSKENAEASAIATIKGLRGIFYSPVNVIRVEIIHP